MHYQTIIVIGTLEKNVCVLCDLIIYDGHFALDKLHLVWYVIPSSDRARKDPWAQTDTETERQGPRQRQRERLACGGSGVGAVLTELGVELAAVMTPPVILSVVVPGLDRWLPAVEATFTEPSDSFTWEPWALPTTCQSLGRGGAESMWERGVEGATQTRGPWEASDAAFNSNPSQSIQSLSGF